MLNVIDATYRSPIESAREGFAVKLGGQVIQTKISREGVVHKVVREWGVPDDGKEAEARGAPAQAWRAAPA